MANPLSGWTVDRSSVRMLGEGLKRPECILAEPDGTVWTADLRGTAMRIAPDGSQSLLRAPAGGPYAGADSVIDGTGGVSLPNGLAFAANGDLLVANFGTNRLERVTRDGGYAVLLSEIDGRPLGKTNFVLRDRQDRIWFTVTTRQEPWTRCIAERTPDGCVGVIDGKGARILAEGFVGTNELRLDAAEEWLYVVETNARRISRLRIGPDAALSGREVYGPDDLGGLPDGCAFDEHGNLWITLVLYDRLIALTPEGDVLTLLEDGTPEATARLDRAFRAGTVGPEILEAARGTLAPGMASITFGGPDRTMIYLGNLHGSRVPVARAPVPGLKLAHWP